MEPITTTLKKQATRPARQLNSETAPTLPIIEPTCKICNDVGFYRLDLPVGHPEFGRLQPCECRAHVNVQRLQDRSRLSAIERNYSLDMLVTQGKPGTLAMVHAARQFVDHPSGFLTISGNFGNGKTTTLMAIVNACVKANRGAVYITFYDLIGYVKEAFTGNGASEWQRVNELAKVPVLCIDELDKVKETEWVQQTITHLLDLRYRGAVAGDMGTVLAFNGTMKDIPHQWITSRMNEGVVIVNNDKDLRPEIAKEAARLRKMEG